MVVLGGAVIAAVSAPIVWIGLRRRWQARQFIYAMLIAGLILGALFSLYFVRLPPRDTLVLLLLLAAVSYFYLTGMIPWLDRALKKRRS